MKTNVVRLLKHSRKCEIFQREYIEDYSAMKNGEKFYIMDLCNYSGKNWDRLWEIPICHHGGKN